ncbi:MAG: hypothetical protein IJX75_05715 [Clostridia bacterium]|nr:hypothetical protein [Clostridia bacterium]
MEKEPNIEQDEPTKEEIGEQTKTEVSVKKCKGVHWVLCVIIAVCSFLGGVLAVNLSLDPEMRALMRAKSAIDALYYKEIDDSDFYRVLFNAMNGQVLDDYSWYMTADEYAESNKEATGSRSGLGLVFLTKNAENQPQMLITRVCGNSPAEAAGLTAGEYVVGFGKSQTEMTESNVFDEFSAFLNEYDAEERFFIRVRQGETERIVEIYKSEYVENYVFYRTNTTAYRFTGKKATDLVEGGLSLPTLPADTAYIRLQQFNGSAATEFDKVMQIFKNEGKKHLVLDLRGNGGGYLDVMQRIASYFCKNTKSKKPVVAVADYGEYKEKFDASGNYFYQYFTDESRICVLADSDTASASECLIGCMVDYGATAFADICLTEKNGVAKTFGKGIMQTTYPFPFSGDAIKLTTAQILWPTSNRCIHGRGVLPEDGALTVQKQEFDDNEIEKALQTLFSQK